MSKLCWMGETQSFESILIELGHSKQKIKKIGLSKKERARLIRHKSEFTLPDGLYNMGIINPTYKAKEVPIILDERDSFLAIHKPTGVHIHPLSYNESDNLLSFLRENGHYEYIQNFSPTTLWDGGLLFRLDFETSGLVLLTNSQEEYNKARNNQLDIRLKEYLVVVQGYYKGPEGVIQHCISTSGKKVVEDRTKGSESHIEIEILESNELQSLLKVKLKEGRRHQIRIQLSLLGFPIWGDQLYGATADSQGLFGLHCYHYQLSNGVDFYDREFWGIEQFNFTDLS